MTAQSTKPRKTSKGNGGVHKAKSKKTQQPPAIDTDNLPEPKDWHKKIPIETIIALHDKDLTHEQISKLTGCSPSNITQRLHREGITTLKNHTAKKDKIFEWLQRKILQTISLEDIQKAPFGTRLTAIAILQDKIMAIRGELPSVVVPMVVFGTPPKGWKAGAIDVTPGSEADNSIGHDTGNSSSDNAALDREESKPAGRGE